MKGSAVPLSAQQNITQTVGNLVKNNFTSNKCGQLNVGYQKPTEVFPRPACHRIAHILSVSFRKLLYLPVQVSQGKQIILLKGLTQLSIRLELR